MKFKKLASLVLTGAMIASMSMSAFASWGGFGGSTSGGGASSSATGATVPVGSSVKTATIDIDVATATDVIINPYQMKVEMDNDDVQDKFLSVPVVATNKSTTKVDVTAHVTVTAAGEVKIVGDASTVTTETPGDKNIYVALLVANVDTTANPELTMEVTGDNALTPQLDGQAFSSEDEYKVVPITASGTEVGFGADTDGDNSDPLTLEAGDETNNYFAMQLFGDVNSNTANSWTENDTISASIVLTFKAQPLDVPNS